jgi:hypothetical protein
LTPVVPGALIILAAVVLAAALTASGPGTTAPQCPGRPAVAAVERTAPVSNRRKPHRGASPGATGHRAAALASALAGAPITDPVLAGDALAAAASGTATEVPLGPRAAAVAGRFDAAAARRCPHLRPGQPARWLAWKPDRLLCTACWAAEAQRASRTRQDATCDYCGQHVAAPADPRTPRMYGMTTELPPVTLNFGLCPPCYQADQAPIPTGAA